MIVMKWFDGSSIMPEHEVLSVKQVYGWIKSSDGKIALVSKDGEKWQLPGGKPDTRESLINTLNREVLEETGLKIEVALKPKMFGYWLIVGDGDDYLQVRFIVPVDAPSTSLALKPAEDMTQAREDVVTHASWFSLPEAEQAISWLKDSKEYGAFKRA